MAKPDGFYQDSDGRTRPRYPKKGGLTLAAAATAGVVALGMGAAGGAGAGAGDSAADSVAGQGLRAKTEQGKSEARKGRTTQAWTRMGWRQLQRNGGHALNCAVNSYGQVRDFFVHNPCKWLRRDLLAVTDGTGNTVIVSIAWVRMGTAGTAERLKDLADTDGTGNVLPLGSAALHLGEVRFTGRHYDSDRRGALTVIAEAAPAAGHPDADTMNAATEIAVLFPPP